MNSNSWREEFARRNDVGKNLEGKTVLLINHNSYPGDGYCCAHLTKQLLDAGAAVEYIQFTGDDEDATKVVDNKLKSIGKKPDAVILYHPVIDYLQPGPLANHLAMALAYRFKDKKIPTLIVDGEETRSLRHHVREAIKQAGAEYRPMLEDPSTLAGEIVQMTAAGRRQGVDSPK